MKTLHRRALVIALLAAPLSAFAHPGHDDDHDFTWSFSHLIEHPLATLGCLGVLGLGAFVAWRFARRADNSTTQTAKPRQ